MAVSYKAGVKGPPSALIAGAISVADQVYASAGAQLVVTSLRDGVHMPGSLHYSGNAVDLRIRDLNQGQLGMILQGLRSRLSGQGFDVILESDHIHIEYDPKPGQSGSPGGSAPQPQPGQIPVVQTPSASSSPILIIAVVVAVILIASR